MFWFYLVAGIVSILALVKFVEGKKVFWFWLFAGFGGLSVAIELFDTSTTVLEIRFNLAFLGFSLVMVVALTYYFVEKWLDSLHVDDLRNQIETLTKELKDAVRRIGELESRPRRPN